MKLHPKRAVALVLALIILCTIQITCVALVASSNGISEESSSEAKASVIKVEPATTETADETKTNESSEVETSVEEKTVAPEMVPAKTKKPAEVKKAKNKDVTTESVITENIDATTESITTENTELSKSSYTEDDLFYLAAAVCREAGGSSEEIQLLVANVVINRVNSSRYPNTIYGVLTQRMQYGTMWKYGISFPKWANQKVKNQCYSVARRILEGERVCPANVVFQAEFKQGSGVYKKFEGFYFCYC